MNPLEIIHSSWDPIRPYLSDPNIELLRTKILPTTSTQPANHKIFRAFSMPVSEIRIVILGQDPYHTPGVATGLAFESARADYAPPSLKVIYEEILQSWPPDEHSREVGGNQPDISKWSNQGVLLLNTALTVKTGDAGSHVKYWRDFTRKTIKFLSATNPCIWLLWGSKAQAFLPYIASPRNLTQYINKGIDIDKFPLDGSNIVLTAPHPAAELYANGNAGFYGCNHFSQVNKILTRQHSNPVIW